MLYEQKHIIPGFNLDSEKVHASIFFIFDCGSVWSECQSLQNQLFAQLRSQVHSYMLRQALVEVGDGCGPLMLYGNATDNYTGTL